MPNQSQFIGMQVIMGNKSTRAHLLRIQQLPRQEMLPEKVERLSTGTRAETFLLLYPTQARAGCVKTDSAVQIKEILSRHQLRIVEHCLKDSKNQLMQLRSQGGLPHVSKLMFNFRIQVYLCPARKGSI
jgi:hypothetical protein